MNLEYFYDYQSEQYAFYQVPKDIVEEEPFCRMSNDSKLLYSIVLDRVKLSRKNGWVDEKRRVYIIFTVEETMRIMHCSKPTATKFMQELERIGLVEKKRQGLGCIRRSSTATGAELNGHRASPERPPQNTV